MAMSPPRLHPQVLPHGPCFSASPNGSYPRVSQGTLGWHPSPIPVSLQLLPAGTKVLRLMPNLPCVVQAGAMVFARGSGAGDGEAALLKSLLSSCGLCEEVPESYINIHTGLSGSGVAYVSTHAQRAPAHQQDTGCRQKSHPCQVGVWGLLFCHAHPRCSSPHQVYLFAEALAEGAVKMGMPGGLASRIAAQTLLVSWCHHSGTPGIAPLPPVPQLPSGSGTLSLPWVAPSRVVE